MGGFVVLFLVSLLGLVFSESKIKNDTKNKTTKSTTHAIWQPVKFDSLLFGNMPLYLLLTTKTVMNQT